MQILKAKPRLLISAMDGNVLERRVMRLLETPWARRWRVVSTAACVVMMGTLSIGVVMFGVRPVLAQILHPNGPLPTFEVATIKRIGDGPVPTSNGGKTVGNFIGTTRDMIEGAYNIPFGAGGRLIGGPSWINTDRYQIQGKISDELFARMEQMTPIEKQTQRSLLKQSLLTDRFKLKVHFEMRELPVYELVVAKGGAKLKQAKPVDPNAPPGPPWPNANYFDTYSRDKGLVVGRDAQGVKEMTAKRMPLDRVANDLEEAAGELGRTVIDKTGLNGDYDFTLKWTNQQTATPDAAAQENQAPSIFTALEEQLGLKLVSSKGMVEVVVIDSIEQPTEN